MKNIKNIIADQSNRPRNGSEDRRDREEIYLRAEHRHKRHNRASR